MTNQRTGLAKYLNQQQYFVARFDSIQHTDHVPKVLLKDLYPVKKNGQKIPLRKNRIKSGSLWVVSDHVWVDFINNDTPLALKQNNNYYELKSGDWIKFQATVKTYKITRSDVLKSNDQFYEQIKQENDELFNEYLTWQKSHYKNLQIKLDEVYQNYLNHNYDFDTMQLLQKNLTKDFKTNKTKRLHSLKQKQKRRLAKYENHKKEKIDYELTNINHVMAINKFDLMNRIKLDIKRLTDYRYTSYLAARSLEGLD